MSKETQDYISEKLADLSKVGHVVLATSADNRTTARTVSIIV